MVFAILAWVLYSPGAVAQVSSGAEAEELYRRVDLGAAAPADSLGGVKVGAEFDRRGFVCETPVNCEAVRAVAGEVGALNVKLCGNKVSEVRFMVSFMDFSLHESLSASGVPVPMGVRPTLDHAADMGRVAEAVRGALIADGWICVGDLEEDAVRGVHLVQNCWARDGRRRVFGAGATKHVLPASGGPMPVQINVSFVSVASAGGQPCLDGL